MHPTRRQVTNGLLGTAALSIARPGLAATAAFDALYARAKKEGALTLYGGGPASWYNDWAAQFKAAFPGIAVTLVGGFSNQLSPRIDDQIKRKAMECDIAILQTLQDFARWKGERALAGLPSEVFDHVDARFRDPDGTFIGASLYTLSYAVNASLAGDLVPASAQDFLKPGLRGKVITVYPQTDDVTLFLFSTIVDKYGWSWMRDYMANKPMFIKGHLGVAQAVAQGKAAATFDTISQLSVTQPGYGASSRVVISATDAMPYWPQTMAIFKGCPHPAAAELFVRWSLTRDQQHAMNRNGVWPVRDDVVPPDGFKPLSSYVLAEGYGALVNDAAKAADLRAKFQTYIGPPVGDDVR